MAKVNSLFMRKANGKLAGATLYTEAGVTIMREINQSPKNPRTHAQMAHRVKLANLVNMYRALRPWLLLGTENKEALKSDYNMFVSRNLTNSPVYLTKQAAKAGYFVPADYAVTAGSLGVQAAFSGIGGGSAGGYAYLIPVGTSASITSSTTFGDFCKLFTEGPAGANGWKNGMQVSIIAFDPQVDVQEMTRNTAIKAFSFVLDTTSTATAASVLGSAFSFFSIESNKLKVTIPLASGFQPTAWLVIASQTIAGKTYVNNSAIVTEGYDGCPYIGEDALETAIQSYGSTTDPYLTTPTPEPLG